MKPKGFRLHIKPDFAHRKLFHMGIPFWGKMMNSTLLMIFQHSYCLLCVP